MPKVTRADWAAQVPAKGIIGVIPGSNLPGTIPDIGQIPAAGFLPGNYPKWNGSKFVPGVLPAPPKPPPTPSTEITPIQPFLTWDVATLRPLESDRIQISLTGINMNMQIVVGAPIGTDFLFFVAQVIAPDTIEIIATNMSGDVISLPSTTYNMWVFN